MITENYLMKLVKEYASSPAGKAAIKRHTGLIYTDDNPSAKLTLYGEQMKSVLYQYVNAQIKSITLEDIVVQKPYQDIDGIWKLKVSFRDGALQRDSLDVDAFPEGINNIILLFTKGYHARNFVHGWWIDKYGNHGNVRSRKDREGNDFLVKAVAKFNSVYGKDIAKAELLGNYKECSET